MATAYDTPFIGRTDELGRLEGLLERAGEGRRSVALVAGDAGIGKTRLLTEFAAAAAERDARVLVGGCMETGDVGLPYVPFVDAFHELGTDPAEAEIVSRLIGVVPALARLLPAIEEDRSAAASSGDGFEQVELFGGVLSLLLRLSEKAQTVLVIEDLHWADRSTRDLFGFLVRTLRSERVALVASYRSDELYRRHPLRPLLSELVRMTDVDRIDLSPFTRSELSAYLDVLVGERVDPDAVDRVLARSEGNAFFTQQLVAAGVIREEVELPEALVDVLRGRIEALTEPTQELLDVAAVAGRRVAHELLVDAAAGPEQEVEASLREAIAAQVLVADPATDSYRFRHALLQEAVYTDLLPGERSRLHGAYARLLSATGAAAELAHHCLASHDLPGALTALVRASHDAAVLSAPAEALSHLTHALEIWDRVPDAPEVTGTDRPALLLKAASAAAHTAEFRRAAAFAREAVAAVEGSPDAAVVALAHERLGEYLLQSGVLDDETLAAFRRAVALVPTDPPTALRAQVTAGLARALLNAREYEEARRWCDEALSAAKAVGAGEEETHALITLAVLEMRHDNAETARAFLREAQERAAAVGARVQELRARYTLASVELDIGDLETACIKLEDTVAFGESNGLEWSQYGINAGILRLFAYYAAGRWDEAESLAETLDDRMDGAAPLSAAALFIEVGRGRARASERAARLLDLTTTEDWVSYLAGGCGIDLAVWQGDLERARSLAERTLHVLDDAGETWELAAIWPATLGLAAEAEVAEQGRAAGDDAETAAAVTAGEAQLARAREAASRARSTGRQIGPEALAWLARAEAEWTRLAGDDDPAAWASAAEAFAYGYVYEEARCRWRLAEALLRTGRRDEAAEEARRAHSAARGLGAGPLLSEIEALARRGRLDIGPVAGTGRGSAGLTPRELEVLRLVAAGRSNQEIADVLFITRKTASVHVSNILTKLDVKNRVEAAAAARRLGLDGEPPSREEANHGTG